MLILKIVDLARQNPNNVRMTCYRTQDYGMKLKYKDYVWLEGTFSEDHCKKLSKLVSQKTGGNIGLQGLPVTRSGTGFWMYFERMGRKWTS
jgi:hypothetical protein